MTTVDTANAGPAFIKDASKWVLNRPFRFSKLADPLSETWTQRMAVSPNILFLMPGDLVNNKSLFTVAGNSSSAAIEKILGAGGVTETDAASNATYQSLDGNAVKSSIANNELIDPRTLIFENSSRVQTEYRTTVMNYLSLTNSFMPKGVSPLTNDLSPTMIGRDTVAIYYSKGTSASESVTNTFDSSWVEQGSQAITSLVGNINSLGHWLGINTSSATNDPTAGASAGVWAQVQAGITGNKLMLPKLWTGSEFNKSYNVKIVLQSPYGTPEMIFKYVYKPFFHILALALPRPSGAGGSVAYNAPFIIRATAPGFFNIDVGVIASMTISKGTSPTDFSKHGLVKRIELDIELMDIYPQMLNYSGDAPTSAYNISLHSYLATMAGRDPRHAAIADTIAKINSVIDTVIHGPSRLYNDVGDWLTSKFDWTIPIFRGVVAVGSNIADAVNNSASAIYDRVGTAISNLANNTTVRQVIINEGNNYVLPSGEINVEAGELYPGSNLTVYFLKPVNGETSSSYVVLDNPPTVNSAVYSVGQLKALLQNS